jgi:hypothetical protein
MQRAAQRIRNDAGPTIGAIVANIVLGLVIGSAFYNLPETTDGVQQRAVVIFFSLIVNSFSPAYEVNYYSIITNESTRAYQALNRSL